MSDLKAAIQRNLDFIIFRIYRLVAPQERIAARLGKTRDIMRNHLGHMATLPKSPNSDLEKVLACPSLLKSTASRHRRRLG